MMTLVWLLSLHLLSSLLLLLLLLLFYLVFHTSGFHWTPSGGKSPQLFRSLLNILIDISSAVIWMFSVFPWISSTPSFFSMFFGIGPRVPTMINITGTFQFSGLGCYDYHHHNNNNVSLFQYFFFLHNYAWSKNIK